jgi:O-antigen/teichoic acid export membrane protein
MSGLMSRGAILTVSRLSNFAIHLLSPMLLVRVLDVETYGRYQEFIVYVTLLVALCSFAVDSSLTYFLPRYPLRERSLVSQTTAVTLVLSAIVLLVLLLAKPLFLKLTSFDFVVPLAAYVFFFVNPNWVDYYWIAKRQPRLVLYYSALRLLARVGVLLVVAYVTRDVLMIIWSMVAVEAIRSLLVFTYFAGKGVFVSDFKRPEIAEQLSFAAPLGAAALIQNAGRSIGKIVITSTLGPAALAYYATGTYLQPVVRVLRSGIEDAVYPELVRAHNEPRGALRLWQRVNVLNCVMFFPAFILLVYYAKPIIIFLFTDAYLPAVPIFVVYAFFLLRRCFNTDTLLRTTGRSGFMFWGSIGALIANILLIVLLSRSMGMIGPAVAFIAAEVLLEFYFAYEAKRTLKLTVAELADWLSIARIAASCAMAMPILIGFSMLPGPELIRIGVASLLYFSLVLYLAYRLGVMDVARVVGYVWSRITSRSIG